VRQLGGRGRLSVRRCPAIRDADLGRARRRTSRSRARDASFTFDAADLSLKRQRQRQPGSDRSAIRARAVGRPGDNRGRSRGRLGDRCAALESRLGVARLRSDRAGAIDWPDARAASSPWTVSDVSVAEQPIRLARPGRSTPNGRPGGIIRVDEIVLATGNSNLTIAGALGESARATPLTLTLDGSAR